MLTAEEFTQVQARLVEVETEVAALRQKERDCIEKAREFNEARRVATGKATAMLKAAEPLRQEVQEYLAEQKRLHNEKVKAQAEARAKAEAEAKAKEQTELQRLAAENEQLKAALAEKG